MPVEVMAPFKVVEIKKDVTRVPWKVKSKPQDLLLRLNIDPADARTSDEWFSLVSADGKFQQHKRVKDDHTPGDKCVDLLFTDVDPAGSYSLEIDERPNGKKYFLFENQPFAELTGLAGKPREVEPPKAEPAGTADLLVRLEIDPADAREADDTFVLRSDNGYEQKKTLKDDQKPGDKWVDLAFTGLPRDGEFTLEVNGELLFEGVGYGELQTLSGDHPPAGHDAGKGDLRLRIELDPAEAAQADDLFVLTGAPSGYRQQKTLKDDRVHGDQAVDLLFTGIPRGDLLTLHITGPQGPFVAFQDHSYFELSHLSGDPGPDLQPGQWTDQNQPPGNLPPDDV